MSVQAPPPAARAVPFRVGEALTYDVSWSRFLTAGVVTLTVQGRQASGGSTAYYIVGEARPTPFLSRLYSLYYKAETWVDVGTLLPQRGSIYSEEGRRRRHKLTRFDRETGRAEYEVRTATVVRQELSVPPGVHDGLSALYAMRAMSLKSGEQVTIPVSDSGKMYSVRFAVGQMENVETGMGTVRALRVTPQILADGQPLSDRRIALWLSDDSRRLPVRLQVDLLVGSFVLTLRQAD